MRHFIFILLATLVAGCAGNPDQLQEVIGKGHFRGHNIGDKRTPIENGIKGIESVVRTESSLDYEQTINEVEMVAHYEFDGDELYSIQADLFFADSSSLVSFQEKLIANYNTRYGAVNEDGGFLVWQQDGKVEFTLADESIEFGEPKLSLTIYNFDY
jgi:hypothetical protein